MNFDHRRGWIAERIKQLAGIFAIDVGAYAIMSSHHHIVVRVDRERALGWSLEEMLERWTQLFSGPLRNLNHSEKLLCESAVTRV